MKDTLEPMYLTLFTPHLIGLDNTEGEKNTDSVILETMVDEATVDGQADKQNRLVIQGLGSCETILAGNPVFWQKKLARALCFGFMTGVAVTMSAVWIIPN